MSPKQQLIVLLVAAVTLAAAAALRRAGVPTPVVLVVAGLVIGFLPWVPDVSLDPDVALLGLLPLLVFRAAFVSSPRAFARLAAPIGLLAVGLVVITAAAVGAVAHWLAHLPWALSLVLGTAVGPTDAAAATGIASRIGLPRELSTILEGEALFNDGTALVLYGSAVTAATAGHVTAAGTIGSILSASAIGVAIGLGVGIAGRIAAKRIDDTPIEVVLSLLLAYAAYLPAEAAGGSGVLAAVTAGLYLGWHSSGSLSARSRLQSNAFWDILEFLVNGALFVLVGLSFHTFTAEARGPLPRLVATSIAVIATVIVARLVWMYATGWLLRPLRRPGGGPGGGPPGGLAGGRHRLVVGWAGMRGAVTLAAVLAVPTTTSGGHPLAGRDDIIYLGFAVILATLLLQGTTLAPLVRRLALAENPTVAEGERQARIALARRALASIEQAGDVPEEATDGIRAQYAARLRRLEAVGDRPGGAVDDEIAEELLAERQLRQAVLTDQRQVLLDLRAQRRIGATTLRAIERDLDLEEARLH